MSAEEDATKEFARPIEPTEPIPVIPAGRPPGKRAGRVSGHGDGSWRGPAIVAAILVVVAAFGLTVGRNSAGLPEPWSAPAPAAAPFIGAGSGNALTNISAAGVGTVEIDGIAGKVTVTAAATTVVSATGSSGSLLYQLDSATHILHLFCPGSGQCPSAVYTLTIPEHVGLTLHQISGQTTLADLSGPVVITASSTGMSAVGLESASFTASITSGQLDASFTTVPLAVALTVVSAQVTVHLPGAAQYAVSQHVTSGEVGIGVRQSPNAHNTVDATIVSGQISLVRE